MNAYFFKPPIDDISIIAIFKTLEGKLNITEVEPFYFQGSLNPQFTTYDPNILWIAKNMSVGVNGGLLIAATTFVRFYNELNAVTFETSNQCAIYDAVAAVTKHAANAFELNNLAFSRLYVQGYSIINFTGYKLKLN
jgi:hypothetical protein